MPLDADVRVPGSKSITNRALIVAALAEGTSRLEGALVADDTEAMIDCLRRLGFEITGAPDPISSSSSAEHGTVLLVGGRAGRVPSGEADLDVRLAGTVARFLPPLAALGDGVYRFDGTPRMRERPMDQMVEALRALGAEVDEHGGPGCLPFTVRARGLRGGTVSLRGDASSQFVSGLLLSGPYMRDGLDIRLTTELVSEPYVDMTRRVMADFGVDVAGLRVGPGRYQARRYAIEPDASAASYFLAAPLIAGGRVKVLGLGRGSMQGDTRFADVLAAMGADVRWDDDGIEVRSVDGFVGIEVDMADISDTVPTLAVLAAFARTPTRITGIGFIRRKESDRVGNVVAELRRLGVDAVEEPDGMRIAPAAPGQAAVRPATVRTYDDHRMAMAFALASLHEPAIAVDDPACVAKTFPGFWDVFDTVRGRVR